MLGLAFSGMGAGVLAIGPLAQWLITMHGWRAAYLVLGLGTFVVLVPLVWLGVREARSEERRVGKECCSWWACRRCRTRATRWARAPRRRLSRTGGAANKPAGVT